jgi:hypothetical protein
MKALPLILSSAAVLACGIAVMLLWGFSPPPSLAGLEAALLSGGALIYGFTAWRPTLPRWLWLRPVRGTVLVVFGIAAMYVPPQLILSAYLIGVGVRLVWQSACDLTEKADNDPGIAYAYADFMPVPHRPAGAPQARQDQGIQGRDRSFHGVDAYEKVNTARGTP